MKQLLLLISVALLTACANPALRQAEDLGRSNQWPAALRVLDDAIAKDPTDPTLRAAQVRAREQATARLILQIEALRGAGRWDEAQALLSQLALADAKHPRLAALTVDIDRGRRHETQLAAGRAALKAGRIERADAVAREILAEAPQHPGARLLASQVAQARPLESAVGELGPGFQKPVTLEFRDAPLRQVFEALARSSGINFVFDKDVRADARVTVFLRGVTLDEALRVVLGTQQLDRKLLNDSSVLIFPNTAAKQREHQELVTRTLYLTNADVKQVQAMVRTIAKVRDIHIDERLNLLVVRDTPEVLRLVEKLIASVDLPEPEVMLEVEVMELATDQVDALGLQWPETVNYGLPGVVGQVLLSERNQFRASIANPAIVANIKGTAGNSNLLANPKIRVRNRDKAKVHIGQKLPVFTTTTNFTGSTSVAASVSYLDIGLKLDVEPTIQLDNDVVIKVGLEVSNLIRQVTGPGGTTAYEIGTRNTATVLRLADGETQVLAGLINDEDRKSAAGIPGLSRIPLLGRLFGTQTDTRLKTEVVLLITPRVVRNLAVPDASLTRLASGVDASPGAYSSLLRREARVGVGPSGGAVAAPAAATAATAATAAAAAAEATLRLDVTPQIPAGGTVAVALKNDSGATVRAELEYDASRLTAAQPVANAPAGRYPVELPPRGERVVALRALPSAAGQALNIGVGSLQAAGANGEAVPVRVDGSGLVTVEAAR
ncbi:secretin N-terminal domain-containing protein [Roseateles asaccharophilus]|uniref:General secretion pathway protein D n=1 Tax=Roseateles asaccharophilus TaxID=582607 RepID=A0ABU2ADZ0_9BURK|nr:secretin N-terminal domain-containing protein [Roseateles asaccharophilus]MDR7335195.1 general secretion pathway protein D [Roseateles asaccharophilus]